MSSSYHMKLKAFTEESCNSNMHTGEKFFAAVTFEGLRFASFQTEQKNL